MSDGKALLLVDLQRDFLEEPALFPPVGVLVERVKKLLSGCRRAGIPVVHIRTIVRADGVGRMPHWLRNDDTRCTEGTPGADPQEGLEPLPGETIHIKSFYSAFGNPALDEYLRHAGVGTLLVAGVHTHSCVQATVLDAYQLGYTVRLVSDAVASYAPLHADLTVRHLTGKACDCVTVSELFGESPAGLPPDNENASCETHPVAFIDGEWIGAAGHNLWEMRDPCRWRRLVAFVPVADASEVDRAASLSKHVQPDWADRRSSERRKILQAWEAALARRRAECVELIIREVGKPRTEAEAEFGYTLRLLHGCIGRLADEIPDRPADDVTVRYRPRGVVAVITPWNNPLALPVGKLAPALAYGNTVIWKPALQSPALVRVLVGTLVEAGLPANCVNVVLGDASTARSLLMRPEIDAVSFTGSENAGREISTACGLRGIPLQAELGGNNAVLIAADADIRQVACDLAQAVFSFSGQRCTAPRRLIVVEQIFEEFSAALVEAVRALKIGDPGNAGTHLGPLISRARRDIMARWVRQALDNGGRLLTGGHVPAALAGGCWFEPTILTDLAADSALVREETFGPLAVLLKAKDFDHGIELVNSVRQGLRAILCSESERAQNQFVKRIQAGLIHLNGMAVSINEDAPFLGWKCSGIGLPEHGRWDRDFYTRTQAVYGKTSAISSLI
jgi:alpha-ketoglutaric semialdehyde dehydrogenase